MEGLAVAIQQQKIGFPEGIIVTELEQFEYELTRTGVRYSAPEGLHDDCVCSLALAQRRRSVVRPGENILDYLEEQDKVIKPASNDRPKITPIASQCDFDSHFNQR